MYRFKMLLKFSLLFVLCLCGVCIAQQNIDDSCPIQCNSSNNFETFIRNQFCLPLLGYPVRNTAEYKVKFVGTWNDTNHDFHRAPNHWSPMSGVSHVAAYEIWENCFRNVTQGVKDVSERGSPIQIEREYAENSIYVFDSFRGDLISGDGMSERTLKVSKNFHYVSVISMMGNTPDYMIGVDRLDLLRSNNRRNWKKSVKYCVTLYSSGTKTKPVRCPNSIQFTNCSFGYFKFTLLPPPLICQQNEINNEKPFMCDRSCALNGRRPFYCRIRMNKPRCVCALGYMRNRLGECVSKEDCSVQEINYGECDLSEWEMFGISHLLNGDTDMSEMRYVTQPQLANFQACKFQSLFRPYPCESDECRTKLDLIDPGCGVWIDTCSLNVQCGTTNEYDYTMDKIETVQGKYGNFKSWVQLEKNGLIANLDFQLRCIKQADSCNWETPDLIV